jgi:uncharacterized SAM-binding protein YcdF (DUF218 family)
MGKTIRRKSTRVFFSSYSILIAMALILFGQQILLLIGNYLVVDDNLSPVDVIHVIAGDDYRTDYAIQLYKQGYAKIIFFTGGWCTHHDWYHGIHGQQRALSQGVPLEAIAYDDTSVTSTYSETVILKAWMDQSPVPIHSVIVVSDPFHMRRARWTYRFVLGKGINILMAPVPFDQTPFKQQWWTDESSTMYVRDEYIKMVYSFFRYQLSIHWLARFDTE